MNGFLTLLKMEFLNNRKIVNNRSKFLQCLIFVLKIVGVVFVGTVLSVVFSYVIKLFNNADLQNEFLVYFILAFQVIILILATIQMTKVLKTANENKEILTLPISPVKLFFSKITYFYISIFVFSLIVLIPVLISFGIITSQATYFYFTLLPNMIFIPVIPFFLGVLVSVPMVRVVVLLEKKSFVLFITFALLIVVLFAGYTQILKILLDIFNNESSSSMISLEMATTIRDFSSYLYLPVLIKNIFIKSYVLQSFLILVNLFLLCIILLYLFAKKYYLNILRNSLLLEKNNVKISSSLKSNNKFLTLVKKDFLCIKRSKNYSFSYLAVTFTTPIMVFFCNAVISDIGITISGAKIISALTFFVLLIFMIVGTSFSATTITREGKSFAITKTIPISPQMQIKAKLFIYLIVAIPVVIISVALLFFANYINLADFIIIASSVSLIVFASICFSMNTDIRKPKFNYLTNNEVIQSNSNISLCIGVQMCVALILGFCSIIMMYTVEKSTWHLAILLFAGVYLLLNYFLLFKNVNKKYNNIEL